MLRSIALCATLSLFSDALVSGNVSAQYVNTGGHMSRRLSILSCFENQLKFSERCPSKTNSSFHFCRLIVHTQIQFAKIHIVVDSFNDGVLTYVGLNRVSIF